MRVLLVLPLLAACSTLPPSRDLYACADGFNVLVDRDRWGTDLILSTGEVRDMTRIPSTTGLRYTADQLHWFEHGDEALLERKGAASPCRLITRAVPD